MIDHLSLLSLTLLEQKLNQSKNGVSKSIPIARPINLKGKSKTSQHQW